MLYAVQQAQANILPDCDNPAEFLLGPDNSAVASRASQAAGRHIDGRQVAADLCRTACSVVELSGQRFSSFLEHIKDLIKRNEYEGLVIGKRRRYDETPHKLRTDQPSSGDVPGFTERDGTVAKVLQTEFCVFVLLRDIANNQYIQTVFRVPTWLQNLESCTGELILKAQNAIEDCVKNLQDVSQLFNLRVTLPCTDRHPSNSWAEVQQQLERPGWTRMHTFCSVHRASSCTKAGLSVVEGHVGGLLSISMCARFAGATQQLRKILAGIIAERLVVKTGPPKATQYRRFIYDLYLDTTITTKRSLKIQRHLRLKQRFILDKCFNGDLQSEDVVEHMSLSPLPRDVVLSMIIKYGVPALIPHCCPRVNRGNFLGHEGAISWCGLIASHHGLLKPLLFTYCNFHEKVPHVLPADGMSWASVMKIKAVQNRQEDAGAVVAKDLTGIDVDQAGGDSRAGPEQKDEDVSWADMNRATKRKAAMYAATSPGHILAILQLALRPMQGLLMAYIRLGSKAWEHDQNKASVQGYQRSYKVLELHKGKQTKRFFDQLFQLLLTPATMLPLKAMTGSCLALMFRLLSKLGCSVQQLLVTAHESFPYKLFGLLEGAVQEVLGSEPCLRDELTNFFIAMFPTVEELSSTLSVNMLSSIARMAEVDILTIEAKHSSTRRLVHLKSCQTWALKFSFLSAEWTTRQHVSHSQRFCNHSQESKEKSKSKTKTRRRKGRRLQHGRGGHGGAWRAYLHMTQSGRKDGRPGYLHSSSAAKSYHQLKSSGGGEWERVKELGDVMRIAGKRKISALRNMKETVQPPAKAAKSSRAKALEDGDSFGAEIKEEARSWRLVSSTKKRDASDEASTVAMQLASNMPPRCAELLAFPSADAFEESNGMNKTLCTLGGAKEPACLEMQASATPAMKDCLATRLSNF